MKSFSKITIFSISLLFPFAHAFAVWNGSAYAPGSTLNPECGPTDTNCNVNPGYAVSNGNFGIGTTSPYAKLSVTGQVVGQYFTATSSTASVFPYASTTALTVADAFYIGGIPLRTILGKSIFFGSDAGQSVVNASNSNFIGESAGARATSAGNSNFLGYRAGADATNAVYSNFFGNFAGDGATNAIYANFLGTFAGFGATDAKYSNFIGENSGSYALTASYSNFIGSSAGYQATNASSSNFFGALAGYQSSAASFSNFFGSRAGQSATNAANSIFIGREAGNSDIVNNTSGNKSSILIGNYTSTGGFSDSIAIGQGTENSAIEQLNIGNILYATGISTSTTATATPSPSGRFGVGTSSPSQTLSVKGGVYLDSIAEGSVLIGVTPGRLVELQGSTANTVMNIRNRDDAFDSHGESVNFRFATANNTFKGLAGYIYRNADSRFAGSPATEALELASAGDVMIYTSSTTANMYTFAKITSMLGGNVGIGTTSPFARLSIQQSANTAAGGFNIAASDSDNRSIYMDTSNVLNFEGNGNIATLSAAGSWVSASDISYKKDVVNIKYGLKDLLALQPRSYIMKSDGSQQIGFIAQEMRSIVPEVVEGEAGRMGISYGQLTALTVSATQDISKLLGVTYESGVNIPRSARLDSIEKRLGVLEALSLSSSAAPTKEKVTGITIHDSDTDIVYCVRVVSGILKTVQGECTATRPASNISVNNEALVILPTVETPQSNTQSSSTPTTSTVTEASTTPSVVPPSGGTTSTTPDVVTIPNVSAESIPATSATSATSSPTPEAPLVVAEVVQATVPETQVASPAKPSPTPNTQ